MFINQPRMEDSEFCPPGHPSCMADAPSSKSQITTSSIRNNTINAYQPSSNALLPGQIGWHNCIGAIIVSTLLLIALGMWLAVAQWPRRHLWCWCANRKARKEKTTPKIPGSGKMEGPVGEEMWLEGKGGSISPNPQYVSPVQTAGPMELGYMADWEREVANAHHDEEVGPSYFRQFQ
jgi:hypothetical protein